MKILLVLNASVPTQQGLWEQVYEAGVDLHVVFSLAVPGQPQQAEPRFGTRHQLDVVPLRGPRLTWFAYRGLHSLIRSIRPDVVHVLNEPWSVAAMQTTASIQARVVAHGCEDIWDQGRVAEVAVRRAIAGACLRRAHGFASWNRAGVDWARSWGLPADRPTHVVSAELPRLERFRRTPARVAASRARWGVDGETVVGFVGRLVAQKGIDWLLRSWSAAALPRSTRLLFVGAGPLAATIERSATLDDRIRLVGPVPPDDVPDVMAALDVLVLPSHTTPRWQEQYGRVITEAMASGVAVIASDSGAIPEVVGNAGIVVAEGSLPDLVSGLRRTVLDPEFRSRTACAGLSRAHAVFSPVVEAGRMVRFWDEVIARPVR
jgi:glycosyltransferase involved in cell wall biosynthesis